LGSNNFYSISFIDESLGIALTGFVAPCYYSNILKTTNGGMSWSTVQDFYDIDC